MARISVALASYNGARFIDQQLDSLMRQTELPHEIVVCDDGSSDNTLAIVTAFARRAPFAVRIYSNEVRLGFADNFLKAARLCEGDLIAFCDQDDVWHERKLETCAYPFAADPDVLLAHHAADLVDETGALLGRTFPAITRSRVARPLDLDPWYIPAGFSLVFAARLLDMADFRHRPPSQVAVAGGFQAHDQWAYFVAGVAGKVAFLSDRLCLYRLHGANTCGVSDAATLRTTLQKSTQTGEGTYRGLAGIATQYARYLEAAAADHEAMLRRRFEHGADFFRRLSHTLLLRAALYAPGNSRRQRVARFLSLAGQNAYRSRRRGGLGTLSLVKDAMFSLVRR